MRNEKVIEFWIISDEMESEGVAGAKSFLIRDLLRDLIVKNTENDETSDNDDSGKLRTILINSNSELFSIINFPI